MALLHYWDFEPAAEGWTFVTTPGAIAERFEDAAFPERGSWGFKAITIANFQDAYVRQDNWHAGLGAGESVYIGYWFRISSFQSLGTASLDSYYFGDLSWRIITQANRRYWLRCIDDGAANQDLAFVLLEADRWYWIVLKLTRATGAAGNDGGGELWIDGQLRELRNNVDNFNRVDDPGDRLQIGVEIGRPDLELYYDEVKISATYPEPFVPEPTTANPSPERTVVLYRDASTDSFEFADYCVSELGIPRSNLCPLPNATANESLATYVVFETEVEDDLNAWLTTNPTVAAQVTCFLIGYGVPGYYTNAGTLFSATSRLMSLGVAFDGTSDNNAFYQTTDRLTKTVLGANQYMCMRIDADTLANAKLILDAGITVTALAETTDADTLYTDDTTYLATLNFGKLRMESSALGTLTNDAFGFGDLGVPSFGAAGSRVGFMDNDSVAAAEGLRAAGDSECAAALITGGYAEAGGRSQGTGLDDYDIDTFFEVLRLGYTMAEATRLCVQKTNFYSVFAGNPLITVAFQDDGYNLYSGIIGSIDYDNPVAYFRRGASSGSLVITPAIDTTYEYSLRAVRNDIETPGVDCIADFKTDGSADWLGNRPDRVINVRIEQDVGAVIRVGWDYITGSTEAIQFALWYDTVPPDGAGAPDATVAYTADIPYSHDETLVDGVAYFVRVVAQSVGPVNSDAVIVGPLLADSTAPDVSAQLITQTF